MKAETNAHTDIETGSEWETYDLEVILDMQEDPETGEGSYHSTMTMYACRKDGDEWAPGQVDIDDNGEQVQLRLTPTQLREMAYELEKLANWIETGDIDRSK